MTGWVLLRGNGGYVNLAQVTAIVPAEPSSGQWVPRASLAMGSPVDIQAGVLFATAAETSDFIRGLVLGHDPEA